MLLQAGLAVVGGGVVVLVERLAGERGPQRRARAHRRRAAPLAAAPQRPRRRAPEAPAAAAAQQRPHLTVRRRLHLTKTTAHIIYLFTNIVETKYMLAFYFSHSLCGFITIWEILEHVQRSQIPAGQYPYKMRTTLLAIHAAFQCLHGPTDRCNLLHF